MKLDEPVNAVRLVGPFLENVVSLLNQQDLPPKRSGQDEAPKDIFDQLDHIVFSYLKEKHYLKFKGSDLWTKYLNFMILSEQKVTEDDFTLFRVLGRGGFGLVNGCKKCTIGESNREYHLCGNALFMCLHYR